MLVRTSNPGAALFQDLDCGGIKVYRTVAECVADWNESGLGACGLGDVGATTTLRLNLSDPDPVALERFADALPEAVAEAASGVYREAVRDLFLSYGTERGRRIAGFPADAVARVLGGRFVSVPRGDLAALLFGAASSVTETIFGDSVASIEERQGFVGVRFDSGAVRRERFIVILRFVSLNGKPGG